MKRLPFIGGRRKEPHRDGAHVTRGVRLAGLAGAAAALAMAVGLLGSQAALAGNPMTLSGNTSDIFSGVRTVAASVGGTPCTSVPQIKSAPFQLSLPASCGTAGQAVTFSVAGAPAGLKTQSNATCLQFAPGTAVSNLTIVTGGTPDTSCAAPGSSPTPSIIVNPCAIMPSCGGASSPNAKPLVLTPNGTWHSTKGYSDSGGVCWGEEFLPGDDYGNSPSDVRVGYSHVHVGDACWAWDDSFQRGAVQFDWSKANSYVQAHGFKSATLSYSFDPLGVGCVSKVEEDSTDLSNLNPFPDVIPDGQSLTPAPVITPTSATMDVGGVLAFGQLFGGVDPHMHFVFIGPDESLSEQGNTSCEVTLDNFKLTIVPEH